MTHAFRGKAWESLLTEWHFLYKAKGWANIHKTEPPVARDKRATNRLRTGKRLVNRFVAFYSAKGAPDYVGVCQGRAFEFDAKETQTAHFPLEMLKRNQADSFDACEKAGGTAFVALRYLPDGARSMRCVVLPWKELRGPWGRWRLKRDRNERAKAGEARLSEAQIEAMGLEMTGTGWISCFFPMVWTKGF